VPINPGDQPFKATDCPAIQLNEHQDPAPLVAPHSGKHYVVHLKVGCDQEAQPISLLYKAQILPVDATGKVDPNGKLIGELDGYIATAPLPLVTADRRVWARGFQLANGLLHLLLAPLVLALVGVLLNEAAKKREEDRQNKQDQRDKRFQQEQEARDQIALASRERQSVMVGILLNDYHKLVTGDYLPISRRMQTVESEMPQSLRNPPVGPLTPPLTEDDIEIVLVAIFLFRARLQAMFSRRGGIYFYSQPAELLFKALMDGFMSRFYQRIGKIESWQMIEMTDPQDSLIAVLEKYRALEGSKAEVYQIVRKRFLEWVNLGPADCRAHSRLLQIAEAVLTFECDRPFYQTNPVECLSSLKEMTLPTPGWYLHPPTLELDTDMYEIPDELREDRPGRTGIYSQLRSYLDGLPRECIRNGAKLP
jgi:hypothetical protein